MVENGWEWENKSEEKATEFFKNNLQRALSEESIEVAQKVIERVSELRSKKAAQDKLCPVSSEEVEEIYKNEVGNKAKEETLDEIRSTSFTIPNYERLSNKEIILCQELGIEQIPKYMEEAGGYCTCLRFTKPFNDFLPQVLDEDTSAQFNGAELCEIRINTAGGFKLQYFEYYTINDKEYKVGIVLENGTVLVTIDPPDYEAFAKKEKCYDWSEIKRMIIILAKNGYDISGIPEKLKMPDKVTKEERRLLRELFTLIHTGERSYLQGYKTESNGINGIIDESSDNSKDSAVRDSVNVVVSKDDSLEIRYFENHKIGDKQFHVGIVVSNNNVSLIIKEDLYNGFTDYLKLPVLTLQEGAISYKEFREIAKNFDWSEIERMIEILATYGYDISGVPQELRPEQHKAMDIGVGLDRTSPVPSELQEVVNGHKEIEQASK